MIVAIICIALLVQTAEIAIGASLAKVSLTATQATQTSISLTWDKIDGASGYQIYRATSKSGTYKLVKTITDGSTTTYKNTGLTLGKTYYYKVRAYTKSGTKKTYGSYSTVKSVRLTYSKPKYTVYVPTSISQSKGTIVITITNNSKSANLYFDGTFAIEEEGSTDSAIHSATLLSYLRVDSGVSGTLKSGSRLKISPGEKVRFTCQLDDIWDYDRTKVRITAVVRYKQQDFVGVYSISGKNQIFTTAEYYDYLFG